MEYTSPGAAISQGLQQGLTLASNFQQIRAQREQAQWERQLKTAEMGMKLTENKNLPLEQRANAFNQGVRPVLARMGMNMPEMNAKTIQTDTFQDAVKNSNAVIDQMQDKKNPLDPHIGFKAITQHFTGALATMDAETEAQKTQRELIVNNAKQYVDEADKVKAHISDRTPTEDEAIANNTKLVMEYAGINKGGDVAAQITAQALKKAGYDVDPGKISPEMVSMVKNQIFTNISANNRLIGDDRLRYKFGDVQPEEAAKLKEMGHSPEEIHRNFNIVGIPSSAKSALVKSAAPMAPAPAPAPAPVARPLTPPPLATPAPMAAPAPVPLPTAGPLSLSGGAVQPTPQAPLRLQDQSLQ